MMLFIIVGVIVLAVSILNENSQGKISLSTIKTLRVLLLENTLP